MVKHVEIVWYHFLSVGSSVAFLISSLFFYKCKSTPFFFFSSSLSLPDLFTHCFFQTRHKETALFRFSFLLTIWFSLLSKPVWLAYLTGDWFFFVVFFRRKPYRHGDTGPLLTEIQTHLPRSILTITFDPNMAPVTAISDGGWWSKTSQERRQCTEVSYEKCRVWAKSESKQQQLWGKNKKNVSTSHWAIAPS